MSEPTPTAPMRKPIVCGPPCKCFAGEDWHQHHEGPAHEAKKREEHEDGADGRGANHVRPSLTELREHRCGCALLEVAAGRRIMSSEAMTAM